MNDDVVERSKAVYRIARSRGFTREAAQEVAQDAAEMVLEKTKQVTQNYYQTYVDAVRRGTERMATRAGFIRRAILLKDPVEAIEKLDATDGTVEDDPEYRAKLYEATSRFYLLNQHQLSIAILYFFSGWTMKMIGDTLGVTEGNICHIVKRILQKLRQD